MRKRRNVSPALPGRSLILVPVPVWPLLLVAPSAAGTGISCPSSTVSFCSVKLVDSFSSEIHTGSQEQQ